VPHSNLPPEEFNLSVELCYLIAAEATQNASQLYFMTQLDSFPPPE
jgi:hypothetical protein